MILWKRKILLLVVLLNLAGCSNFKALTEEKESSGPQVLNNSVSPMLNNAYNAYQEGRLSDAETYYLRYLKKHEHSPEAWFKLGNIYYRTGQYKAAVTAYQNALKQNPKNDRAWYNLALTRVKQAEETLESGEKYFEGGTISRKRLYALKKKIQLRVRTGSSARKNKTKKGK